MKKSGRDKKVPSAAREPDFSSGGLLFEIEPRQLKSLLGRRVVRRRALADSQRRMLERLIEKSGKIDINELTRERLERSIRVNEHFAEFLAFSSDHLVGGRGKRRLTTSDLAALDLIPRETLY